MFGTEKLKISYLKKIFYFTHATGLVAGILFPYACSFVIGPVALRPTFYLCSLAMGFSVGACMFLFVRFTLKKQLGEQLKQLRPLTGEVALESDTVESMQLAVESSVAQVDSLIRQVLDTVDRFVPHYKMLAEASHYLSDRTRDGLQAAGEARKDVEGLEEKQQGISAQMELLSRRSQDEAALSRQLSASLEEMSSAMEVSTSKFLETTTSVDELASSVREAATQAEDIARSVEGTSQDLDAIGESLEKIRQGAFASAEGAGAVKTDAEQGLQVVQTSMQEMERIELESKKALGAMQRLSLQTGEVAKIIEVIKELVSDTELLAFNAAIIAAKAGEEGKGFSVVAEEIRDLADRTTTSAQDIHRIVKTIGGDTREVLGAVESTGERITRGKQLSIAAGEALRKIAESSSEAAAASDEIATLTGREEERAGTLLRDAGNSLKSVRAVARAMQEQQVAIVRIQEGVGEMKGAADQIARGMEEQVRANHEYDKGLLEREDQVNAINEAIRFQMITTQRVFAHFNNSEARLRRNADRAVNIKRETDELEVLAGKLRELGEAFGRGVAGGEISG